jgi:ribosome-associated translation inhibitor RaiA
LDVAVDWETGDAKIDNAIRAAVSAVEARLETRLQKLEHHLEHQLAAVQDDLTHTIHGIDEREKSSEERLKDMQQSLRRGLATEVGSKMSNSIESRLATLELKLTDAYKQHVQEGIDGVRRDALDAGTDAAAAQDAAVLNAPRSREWILPYALLVLMCGAVGFYVWRMQQQLHKSHLP